ncbi:MAG: hypothetical protein ACRETH_05215 [Steroidobacteraceae bacterium]
MGLFHHHGRAQGAVSRDQLSAMRAIRDVAAVCDREKRQAIERQLDLGLEAAPSVQDRTISLFVRGDHPQFAGITIFLKGPYCESIRDVGKYDVAFVGAPFDMGATYRPPGGVIRRALRPWRSMDLPLERPQE